MNPLRRPVWSIGPSADSQKGLNMLMCRSLDHLHTEPTLHLALARTSLHIEGSQVQRLWDLGKLHVATFAFAGELCQKLGLYKRPAHPDTPLTTLCTFLRSSMAMKAIALPVQKLLLQVTGEEEKFFVVGAAEHATSSPNLFRQTCFLEILPL